ncbi:MAG: Smr/MutS family protein [Gallionella sp.]|nr:Smr/MutS family protein [Gallionella sp.]
MKKLSKSSPSEINFDDAALFRAAIGEVSPLPQQNRITPKPTRHNAIPHRKNESTIVPDSLSDYFPEESPREFLRNGIARITLRKMRNGTWPIQDQLDLHGNYSDAARKLLQEFLHEATQQELRCVRVIHGKGLNSQGGEGVLRNLTRHWLTQHPLVLAYCEALPAQGGSGAVLVLLKNIS